MADNGERDFFMICADRLKEAYQNALKDGNVEAVLKEGMTYAIAMTKLSESSGKSVLNILVDAPNLQDSPLVHRLEAEANLDAESWLADYFLVQLTKDFGAEKVNEALAKMK